MKRRYASSRFFGVVVVFVLAFGALSVRLAWVQVVRAEHWKGRAADVTQSLVEEDAWRGQILDTHERVLASSEVWHKVGISHPEDWSVREKAGPVASLLGVPESAVETAVRAAVRKKVPHAVIGEFQLEEHRRLALEKVGGVTFDERVKRRYWQAGLAQALLGQVNSAGQGRTGLEAVHDALLAGRSGRVVEFRDARGNVRERRVIEAPQHGPDVVLTLDSHVQTLVERELEKARVDAEADLAQAIVMDPWTGDVVAMAQTPGLPGPTVEGDDVSPWRVVPLTDVFEPGSIFKVFSSASLLRRGVCDTSTVFDGGRRNENERRVTKRFEAGATSFTIRDVHPVGRVSLRHAFVRSSNIIYATAAQELLTEKEIHRDLLGFGFGAKPGLGFPGETKGILRGPDHPKWSLRTLPTLAIGQEIGVTLMQLATGASAVLSDGTLHRPRLVRAHVHPDGRVEDVPPVVVRRGLVDAHLAATLRAMCVDVVDTPYGTGKNARVEGIAVGGKTGTAQVAARTGGYLPGMYNATFVGFAPASDPQLVVVIALHRSKKADVSGGGAAAPVFAAILREIASSTTLLDAGVRETVHAVDTVRTPDLVGRTVDEIRELADRAVWGAALPSLPRGGFVVGQMPLPGTPMRPGAVMQLAYARGSR